MRWTILLIMMVLGGCGPAAQSTLEPEAAPDRSQALPPKPHAIAPPAPQLPPPPGSKPSTPSVQVFQATPDCSSLVSQAVTVPEVTLDAVVGAAIAQFETTDFPLAGYRVQHQAETQTVTIDLRLPPDSSRPLTALSQCEQFALFGSLRQTVMQFDPGVQTVQFQAHGAAID